jgi:hypothetical protein
MRDSDGVAFGRTFLELLPLFGKGLVLSPVQPGETVAVYTETVRGGYATRHR